MNQAPTAADNPANMRERVHEPKCKGDMTMNTTEIAAPAGADIRPITDAELTDAELDDVNGGLGPVAAAGVAFLFGYGVGTLVKDALD
jgi:lactobin A/cerein 7B family class IIb bacteriocin